MQKSHTLLSHSSHWAESVAPGHSKLGIITHAEEFDERLGKQDVALFAIGPKVRQASDEISGVVSH